MHRKNSLWRRLMGLTLSVAILMGQPVTYATASEVIVKDSEIVVADEKSAEQDNLQEIPEEETEEHISENTISENEILPNKTEGEVILQEEIESEDIIISPKDSQLSEANILGDTTDPVYPQRDGSLTPLSNLAFGFPVFLDDGTHSGSPENAGKNLGLIVDGDKYSDSDFNGVNGIAEDYHGKSADSGDSKYIQIDLKDSFEIEVINIKRTYNKTFKNTAIVIAEKADFSDAQVIYYQEGIKSELEAANMTFVADKASSAYAETYGGEWFYMEGDGITPTSPQTVKKARYVRIYSTNPDGTTVKTDANDAHDEHGGNDVGFVEVAVYGYEDASRKEEAKRDLVLYSSENPLIISSLYSSSKPSNFEIKYGSDGNNSDPEAYTVAPEFKHTDTIEGRWKALPENQKKNNVILIHTDNLGMNPGQIWGDASRVNLIPVKQEMYQNFYERSFAAGYRYLQTEGEYIPMMMVAITAGAVPQQTVDNNGNVYNGVYYNISSAADPGWVDLMYRMYPNFKGTFNPENHWVGSGAFDDVAVASARALEMAALHNAYFIWSESVQTFEHENVRNCTTWTEAMKKHGANHLYMTFKTTGAVGGKYEHPTTAYMQGLWLGGYAAGWGGLIDTWSWSNTNQGNYGSHSTSGLNMPWYDLGGYPEGMLGAQLMSMYLEGASVYTFEHPGLTNGVNNKNTPAFDHVIAKCFDYFINNPGPTKKEVMEKTKYILYGNANSATAKNVYASLTNLSDNGGKNYFLYQTGRYGSIPAISAMWNKEEVGAAISKFCVENGIEAPALVTVEVNGVTDPNLTNGRETALFNNVYPKEYNGDAFADIWNGRWFVYNNDHDPGHYAGTNKEDTQEAVLPLTVKTEGQEDNTSARLEATLKAHSYFVADTKVENGEMKIELNNYRTNKDGVYDKGASWVNVDTATTVHKYSEVSFNAGNNNWADVPKSIGARGTSDEDPRNNGSGSAFWNAGLWQYAEAYIENPLDNDMRTTVFKITKLSEAPVVTITDALEWDSTTKTSPQIEGEQSDGTLQVDFTNNTATITVQSNGWVDLTISNLKFMEDEEAEEIKDGERGIENVAQGGTVVVSSNGSNDRPFSRIVDGDVGPDNKDNKYAQTSPGPQWVQIDMGGQYEIESVDMYRYWDNSRKYDNTIILLSPDNTFSPSTTLVLWNAWDNREGITWPSLDGHATVDFTNLAAATDADYMETQDGKTFPVTSNLKMLDGTAVTVGDENSDITDGKFTARYLRVYASGRTDTTSENHYIEIRANGIAGDVGLVDTEKPNGPYNVEVKRIDKTSATLTYDSGSDNTGIAKYKVSVTKEGEVVYSSDDGAALVHTLQNLELNTVYNVSITAVDGYGNEGTPVVVTYTHQIGNEPVELYVALHPTKLSYKEGEAFSISGLIVNGVFSNGTDETISHDMLEFEPADGTILSKEDDGKYITVTYKGTSITTKAGPIMVVIEEPLLPPNPPTPPGEVVYPDNIWVGGISGELTYTGSKIVQDIVVYDGETKLTEKVDYTVTYKNNINANEWTQEGDGIYVESLKPGTEILSVLNTEGSEVYLMSENLTGIEENQADTDRPSDLKKAPQVTIKMKGNYKGSHTIYFEIQKQDIKEAQADDLSVTYVKNKNQTPAPVVTLNGKKLKLNKDFDVKEYTEDKNNKTQSFIGKEDETQEKVLTLRGKGNYDGTKEILLTIGKITGEDGIQEIAMSKAVVKGVKALTFDKDQAKVEGMIQPQFSVKYKKTDLYDEQVSPEKGEFTVSYEENDKVGTASLILTGTGEDKDGDKIAYIGTKRVTFKINGNTMNKAKVEGLDSQGYAYKGEEIRPLESDTDTKVTLQGANIPEDAYTVDYVNNINKGTATIILTGIPEEGYSGVKKQTFKVTAATVDKDTSLEEEKYQIKIIDEAGETGENGEVIMPFTKGGVKPLIAVTAPNGKEMKEGSDYTVTYQNNTKPGTATILVKGKGNFAGTENVSFTIIPKDLSDAENMDDVILVAADKVESTKKNGWKSAVKVLDQDGKALANKKDAMIAEAKYIIESLPENMENISNKETLEALMAEGKDLKEVPAEIIPAGTTITVTVKMAANGNYKGEVSGSYRILETGHDISKARIKIKDQFYTGEEIFIDEDTDFSERSLKINTTQSVTLSLEGEGEAAPSLEVVPGSYVKNVTKGTAKVTLRGIGEFGGTKTVSFKIVQRDVSNIFTGLFDIIMGN